MRQNKKGNLIPSEDVRVSNIRANAFKSNDGSSTGEGYSAGVTLGNRKASVSPSMFSNKNTNETKFDDGVILSQMGKTIGFALNGEVVLNEGVRVRGGLEKTTSSSNGEAVYRGEVIEGFSGSSVSRGANVGLTAGKLNLDYSQREQEGSPKYEKLSGRYDLGNDSNITGDIDSDKNINVTYNKRFAKGGNVEQMNKLFADGGMMDDSGEQVNGVEVPLGSLKEEVADDIPARLSEGEFVVPADVVRFIGLEKLMAMRDKAKQGLLRMEEMGQMGNAEEVENPDQSFMQDDEDFSSEIDDIMAEDEPTDMMAEESPMPAGFARGGYASGTDLSKANQNPAVDVRYFKNAEGKVMFITYINGAPLVSIPDGFTETKETYEQLVGNAADKKAAAEEESVIEEKKRLDSLGISSSGESNTGPTGPTGSTPTIGTGLGLQVGVPTPSKSARTAAMILAPVLAIPAALALKGINAAVNANNASATANGFASLGGLSPAGIKAANEAMAAESSRFGFGDNAPTPGSIAAAGATAGSAVNKTNAMDAMMAAIQADKGTPGTIAVDPDAEARGTDSGYTTGADAAAAEAAGAAEAANAENMGGFAVAKGGLIKKRKTKPKAATKGLASRK
jgi:hypothetical protein